MMCDSQLIDSAKKLELYHNLNALDLRASGCYLRREKSLYCSFLALATAACHDLDGWFYASKRPLQSKQSSRVEARDPGSTISTTATFQISARELSNTFKTYNLSDSDSVPSFTITSTGYRSSCDWRFKAVQGIFDSTFRIPLAFNSCHTNPLIHTLHLIHHFQK